MRNEEKTKKIKMNVFFYLSKCENRAKKKRKWKKKKHRTERRRIQRIGKKEEIRKILKRQGQD